MQLHNHHSRPEMWFQSTKRYPVDVLARLIQTKQITVTPRRGVRQKDHPKGYVPGQVATLKVLDNQQQEYFQCQVRIKDVVVKPLRTITATDLVGSELYQDWKDVQNDLSFFEKGPVHGTQIVSMVKFEYL